MQDALSVIVPCYNEELMIGDCLASVGFAQEILVVDSFSTDKTLEIARQFPVRIIQHEYLNSAAQKNWAIPQATNPWVLIVDADERVTPELADEIKGILQSPKCDGYWIRCRNFCLGKEIRHGTWRTDKVLRLFRRDKARYQNKHVHAEIEMEGDIGRCEGAFCHYSCRSLDDFIRKAARYGTWGAMNAQEKGIQGSGWRIFSHCVGHFLKGYLLKGGFLDGTQGLIIALMEADLAFLKYAKLWEIQRLRSPSAAPQPRPRIVPSSCQ